MKYEKPSQELTQGTCEQMCLVVEYGTMQGFQKEMRKKKLWDLVFNFLYHVKSSSTVRSVSYKVNIEENREKCKKEESSQGTGTRMCLTGEYTVYLCCMVCVPMY